MKPQSFDSARTPIEPGFTLIEASAGTGKTYAIAMLVLRCVLERKLRIEEILVCTFTEMATAELRERIRARLTEAFDFFQHGNCEDSFLEAVCGQLERETAQPLLREALENFDRAAIYTIHGFCQRVLADCAFESGALFDLEVMKDASPVFAEIARDFWRRQFLECPMIVSQLASHAKISPNTLQSLLRSFSANPAANVIPKSNSAEFSKIGKKLEALWKELGDCWHAEEEVIRSFFVKGKNVWANGSTVSGKLDSMTKLFGGLNEYFEGGPMPENFDKLKPEVLQKNTKKDYTPPKHRFFELCEEWLLESLNYGDKARAEFWDWAREELRVRKQRRNVLAFDDMLLRLHAALESPVGDPLAGLIRSRFKTTLIDEFQDTDQIQYEIFQRIYANHDLPVFFIGDPKQAIYAFRGADVFTYFNAQREATRSYTLTTNWRSTRKLVDAVNAMFEAPQSFVLDAIAYQPIEASENADSAFIADEGNGVDKPLKLHLVLDEDEKPTAPEANAQVEKIVVSEIISLLNSSVKIEGRRIAPGDCAVLVNTNAQAQQMQAALMNAGILSVLYTAANVFASHEAAELERLLIAISEPFDERFLRTTLMTELIGKTANDLLAMESDQDAWDAVYEQFRNYHEQWNRRGFVQMFEEFLRAENVRARLLTLHDGERRLTNLLQLSELLQKAQMERGGGAEGLLNWLSAQRQSAGELGCATEHELRLERDEGAVRVVTIHRSKGLEYGFVFCPFSWKDPRANRDPFTRFHDESGQLTIAIGEAGAAFKERQTHENLAEQMRQLYVAVTRAKYRCDLIWGNFKSSSKSALTHLIDAHSENGESNVDSKKDAVALLREKALAFSEKSDAMELLEGEPVPTVLDHSHDSPQPDLKPREFQGFIDTTQGVTSFSSLTANAEEMPGWDAQREDVARVSGRLNAESLTGIAAFPRGATPGVCLHEIFEAIDFSDLSSAPEIVNRRLESFGFRGFDGTVCEMIARTVDFPLTKNVKLSRVKRGDRLQELEFYFPINDLNAEKLAAFFANRGRKSGGANWAERLQFQPLGGFMKGFIDLVFQQDGKFYIADWKSNWLGASAADYDEQTLAGEMEHEMYRLQLYLYTVALHRYLRHRLPDYDYEKHFGGAFYVFLRGMDPAKPEHGVYRERPDAETILALDALLGGER